jgi:hypothetical protein
MNREQRVRRQRAGQQTVEEPVLSRQSVNPRILVLPCLALTLALGLALNAAPLLAQTQAEGKDAAATPADTATADAPAAKQAPPATSAPAPTSKGNSSPFDYRSSEEISEDVPVSFPVDI